MDHGTVTVLGRRRPHDDELRAQELREREADSWPPPSPPRCATGGRWATATAACGRASPATSPSCCRPARRCRCSSRRCDRCGVPYRAENSSVVYVAPEVRELLARAPRRRRPDRRAGAGGRSAHRRCTAAATSSCTTGDAPAGAGARSPTPRRGSRTTRSPTASPTCGRSPGDVGELAPAELLDAARRAAPGAGGGPGRARRPRRLAAGPLRRRPGPGVDGRRRAGPAPLPALGRVPGRRGPGQRHDPARARPRRRADHDRARGQGPRVPDHRRVRADDTRCRRRSSMSVVWPAGTWTLAEQGQRRCSRSSARSTSRWATPSGGACCTSPAPAPSTTSWCRCTAAGEDRARARRKATSATVLAEAGAVGHGAVAASSAPRSPCRRRRCRAAHAAVGRPGSVGRRTAPRRGRRRPSARHLGHPTRPRRPARRRAARRRARTTRGCARRESTSTCHRGSAAATARRSGAPCTPSSRTPTSSTGGDIDRLSAAQCAAEGIFGFEARVAALCRSALGAPIVRAAAAGAPALARAVRRRRARPHRARGLRRPAGADRRRAGHRRLQDRPVVERRRAVGPARPLPAPAGRVRRGPRALLDEPIAGGVIVGAGPTVRPTSSRSSGGARRWPRSRALAG